VKILRVSKGKLAAFGEPAFIAALDRVLDALPLLPY
jgi:hypothetical protein